LLSGVFIGWSEGRDRLAYLRAQTVGQQLLPKNRVLSGKSFPNPAAAEDQVVLVKHGRLARGHSALRFTQLYLRLPAGEWRDDRRRPRMVVADLDGGFHFPGRVVEGDPIAAVDGEFVPVEGRFIANDDPVCGGIQFDDVKRPG